MFSMKSGLFALEKHMVMNKQVISDMHHAAGLKCQAAATAAPTNYVLSSQD